MLLPPVLLLVLLLSFPLLALYFTRCLYDSLLLIFPFSIPLTLSSSPFLLPLLLGSLLTLLNVRAQTSPCRAAPSHKGQKQLVSLPFPCFLAASVCLTVCLLQACHPLFLSLIHCSCSSVFSSANHVEMKGIESVVESTSICSLKKKSAMGKCERFCTDMLLKE